MSRAEPLIEIAREHCSIEFMNEHDLLAVVEIEEACGLSQWGWEAYRAELDRPEAIMLVARARSHHNGTHASPPIIGYIAARIDAAGELHINNIGVDASARRRGVGSALLGTALKLGARQGAREALLEVRAANHIAQSLYRLHGFQNVGRRRDYYREPTDDAILMRIHLTALA